MGLLIETRPHQSSRGRQHRTQRHDQIISTRTGAVIETTVSRIIISVIAPDTTRIVGSTIAVEPGAGGLPQRLASVFDVTGADTRPRRRPTIILVGASPLHELAVPLHGRPSRQNPT